MTTPQAKTTHMEIKAQQKSRRPWKGVLALMVWAAGLNAGHAERVAIVTNKGDDSVSVIDVATQGVVDTLSVGVAPVGIVADPLRGLVYVCNSGSASVTRINMLTQRKATLLLSGSEPESVAVTPDGLMIVVTSLERVPIPPLGSRGKVYLIDAFTFTVMNTVLVEDDPEGVAIASDNDVAWFASDLKIQELIIDPFDPLFLTLTRVIDGVELVDDYEDVIVSIDKSRLFVTNDEQNRVEVIDLSIETIIGTVPTGSSPEAVVFRPQTDEAHVTNQGADSITIFDRTTFTVLDTLALSLLEPRGLAFLPDGSEGYVVMSQSNAVIRYDASARAETGDPIGVGLQPEEIVIFDLPINDARHWRTYE